MLVFDDPYVFDGQFFLTLVGSCILNWRWVQLAVVGFAHKDLHVLDVHLSLLAVMHCQRLVLFCQATLYRAGSGQSPERSSRCFSPWVSGFVMISRTSSSVQYSIFSCWCVFRACLIFFGVPGRQFCGLLTDFVTVASPHCTLPPTAPVAACL